MKYKFQRAKMKALRSQLGLSQHLMGKRIGLPAQQISAYERGDYVPSTPVLIRLLNVFHLPADYFFVPFNYSDNNISHDPEEGLHHASTDLR